MLLPKLGGSWLLPPRDFPHLTDSSPYGPRQLFIWTRQPTTIDPNQTGASGYRPILLRQINLCFRIEKLLGGWPEYPAIKEIAEFT